MPLSLQSLPSPVTSRHVSMYVALSAQSSLRPRHGTRYVTLFLHNPHSGSVTSRHQVYHTLSTSRHVIRYATLSAQSSLRPRPVMSSGMPLSLHSPHSDPVTSLPLSLSLCTVLTRVTLRHQVCQSVCTVPSQVPSRHQVCLSVCTVIIPVPSTGMPVSLHSSHSNHVTQAQSITSYFGLCAQSSLRPCHIMSPSMPVCLQCPHSGPVTSRHQVCRSVCIVLTQATSRDVTGNRSVCIVLTQAPSRNVICKSVLIHSRLIDHTLEQRWILSKQLKKMDCLVHSQTMYC